MTELESLLAAVIPLLPTLSLSMFAGVTRTFFSDSKKTLVAFLRGIFASVLVGVAVYHLCTAYAMDRNLSSAVVALSSFIADDLLVLLLTFSRKLRENPTETVKTLLMRVFGLK